jgi:hypothetical protein
MKRAYNVFKSDKLIRISLEYDEQKKIIHSITISGDFFLYPEDA